ncbi:MAG: DUF6377 domain-containing protein [Bacteroidales bacterium]|nr:DUF6377 domain-containing protein [Bacteroidales bacterium]
MKNLILLLFSLLSVYDKLHGEKSIFEPLDKVIENRWKYVDEKNRNIQHLKMLLIANPKDEVKNELLRSIYQEYSLLNFDSAFFYCSLLLKKAYKQKDLKFINEVKTKIGFLLISGGLFKEALDTLHSIKRNKLDTKLWHEYYYLLARGYFDLSDYISNEYYSPFYVRSGLAYIDSAIVYCKDSLQVFSYRGLKSIKLREFEKARVYYEKLIQNNRIDKHQYAIEASSLSFVYENLQENNLAIQMLINAAIADIESATKETIAIRILAKYCFQQGDFERAYRYVKIAHEDASIYGARQRNIQVLSILPQIEEYQLKHFMEQKKKYLFYSVIITVLILVNMVFTLIIFKQYRVLKKAKIFLKASNEQLLQINTKLHDANRIKDEYIGYFFDTISKYIYRIESYKSFLHRKVTTKQFGDIVDFIKTIDIKREKENFYRKFDTIFLSIFPHFLESIRGYFKDDNLLVTTNPEQTLSPEMRILALIRIGITENEKIAQFLGYSLNTVYTYKARIKSKLLITMDELEKKLMEISSL